MATIHFSRSNVNESTLNISKPGRSSFDLSERASFSPMLGRIQPYIFRKTIPSDVFRGKMTPTITLENVGTPQIGRTRLDTFHVFVSERRINKDFRSFVEAGAHAQNQSKPSFNANRVAGFLFAFLTRKNASTQVSQSAYLKTIADIATYSSGSGRSLLNQACNNYAAMSESTNTAYHFGYMQDFFLQEFTRLAALRDTCPDDYPLNRVILDILYPYFGENSIANHFGYPSWTYFNWYGGRDWDIAQSNVIWQVAFVSNLMKYKGVRGSAPSVCNHFDYLVDESPLRAAYAGWFDVKRNFHYEKSNDVLNPDNFDHNVLMSVDHSAGSNVQITHFLNMVQLLIPHFATYSRDMLTTIQPDDLYRHVYSPVSLERDGEIYSSSGDTDYDFVDRAVSITLSGLDSFDSISFPSDNSFLTSSSSDTGVLRSDLQTMRRAGMLEKWLARNFYHPDSYSGQIEAHYGVSPQDNGVLQAIYLGGNESMVSGDQLKNPTTTSEAPAGTRTFSGGASVSDEFSLSTTEFGYVISYCALIPLVKYDTVDMHLRELTTADIPYPEYAVDSRVQIAIGNLVRGMSPVDWIGFVPRYVQYRMKLDSAHGSFLTKYRAMDWLRDAYNMPDETLVGDESWTLNPYTMHIHVNMDAFLGVVREYDPIAYGDLDYSFMIDRALPAAVEFI